MERKRYANKWRWAILNITNIPFAAAIKDAVRLQNSFLYLTWPLLIGFDDSQKEKVRKNCFAQDRLAIYESNMERGIPNDFTLDDIKGAAATVYIAGNVSALSHPI